MANIYNDRFKDAVDKLNKMAYMLVGGNAKAWAAKAVRLGIIDYEDRARIEQLVDLRNSMGHGNSMYINVGPNEVREINNYIRIMSNTANQLKGNGGGNRGNGGGTKGNIKLPDGTFRFIKEFRLQGNDMKTYYFKFRIIQEYQKRAYDDGTRFSGTGYTIYVIDAPYKEWCQARSVFHFYNSPADRPSICWNSLITDFQDANAVMITWAKRYVKLLVSYIQSGELNESSAHHRVKNKGILPTGTFRIKNSKNKKHCKSAKRLIVSITEEVYQEILKTIGSMQPEKGGMLGSSDGSIIDTFVFDKNAITGTAEYSPNTNFLNKVLETEWNNISFKGFVHSHPYNGSVLSSADVEYAIRIMNATSQKELFMPLVNSSACGKFRIHGYIVKNDGTVTPCNIKQVKPTKSEVEVIEMDTSFDEDEIMKRFDTNFAPVFDEPSESVFSRVENVLNIDFLKKCTIVGVGCGGAREFYLDMARVGVENFFLMDGDKVSVQNIASQNVYADEIGKQKTDVIQTNILRINSNANVTSIPEMLDDEKNDSWFEDTVLSKCNAEGNILLCAFTDSFMAQARLSRLALKYKIPFLSAQHHAKGETSEIIFWYPEVTQYCHREILKERYESYKNGYQNIVTSEGSPIFNTSRLNSICTKLATGMLLYKDSEFNLYSMFLTMKPNSNLLIIRQNCLLNSDTNLAQIFTSDESGYFFDDVVWVDVDTIVDFNEECECRKKIADTRVLFE